MCGMTIGLLFFIFALGKENVYLVNANGLCGDIQNLRY